MARGWRGLLEYLVFQVGRIRPIVLISCVSLIGSKIDAVALLGTAEEGKSLMGTDVETVSLRGTLL